MSLFTFHNRGSVTPFNPTRKVKGPDGSSTTLLDVNKELVREAARPDVYIINSKGREVLIETLA